MKKGCVLLVFALLMGGCALPSVKSEALMPIVPEKAEIFKPYPSGQVETRTVGEQMIGYNLLLSTEVYPGFIAEESFQLPAASLTTYPSIRKGSVWRVVGKKSDDNYVLKNTTEKIDAIIKGPSGEMIDPNWQVCLLVNGEGEPYGDAFCGMSESEIIISPRVWEHKPQNFLKPTKVLKDTSKAWRKAAIIYAGKTKDFIRILYQETSLKDMEFTFDLYESNIITIKDVTFEILEATNSGIKYIIKTPVEELKSRIEEREKKNREMQNI